MRHGKKKIKNEKIVKVCVYSIEDVIFHCQRSFYHHQFHHSFPLHLCPPSSPWSRRRYFHRNEYKHSSIRTSSDVLISNLYKKKIHFIQFRIKLEMANVIWNKQFVCSYNIIDYMQSSLAGVNVRGDVLIRIYRSLCPHNLYLDYSSPFFFFSFFFYISLFVCVCGLLPVGRPHNFAVHIFLAFIIQQRYIFPLCVCVCVV